MFPGFKKGGYPGTHKNPGLQTLVGGKLRKNRHVDTNTLLCE